MAAVGTDVSQRWFHWQTGSRLPRAGMTRLVGVEEALGRGGGEASEAAAAEEPEGQQLWSPGSSGGRTWVTLKVVVGELGAGSGAPCGPKGKTQVLG